jgi:hypothetical protein
MLSFFLVTTYAKSLSFSCCFCGINTRLAYIKPVKSNKFSIRFLKTPRVKAKEKEFILGWFPAYLSSNGSFDTNLENVANVYLDFSETSYREFRNDTLGSLFDLENYEEHRTRGKPIFSYIENTALLPAGFEKISTEISLRRCLGLDRVNLPVGRRIRELIAEASIFDNHKKVVMVVGPDIKEASGKRLEAFWIANSADQLNLSLDYLIRAARVSESKGDLPVNLWVIGTEGITEADIRKRIDTLIADGEEYKRQVGAALPSEKHSALMGGVGLSAGYHYHTKNFIFNLRTGVDHIWGKFRQTAPQNTDSENMPKLGWGVTLGTGIDYKFTEKSTIGLEGGIRFSEFKIPQQDKPTETKSSWFTAPYAQIVCGFYPTPDYSISVFTGYFFPRTFSVKTEGTRITEGTKCKVDGIFGGLRFARYF